MKTHDVFPFVRYPDLFRKMVRDGIDETWYMFDPREISAKKGYNLGDYYGDGWEKRYNERTFDESISRRSIEVEDLVRLIIKPQTGTGALFTFNYDTVDRTNPNKHKGMIYSSNLCTEITQDASEVHFTSETTETEDGGDTMVTKIKPGNFVMCNFTSLVLGNIDVSNDGKLEEVVETAVRGLDNIIDLNFCSLEYTKHTNKKYRPIGFGTSGYHYCLVKNNIMYSDVEKHLEFTDRLYERISYYAIKAGNKITKEKGSYEYFEGSDWKDGECSKLRDYNSEKWSELYHDIRKNGMKNGYLMAVTPTGSTSIIAGATVAVDPVTSRYFLEEKKGTIVPRVAPGFSPQTFWLYENAYELDQNITVDATSIRQRHIDQGRSVSIYITTGYMMRAISNIHVRTWEKGIKSIYYVRSKSLGVGDCDNCSA